MNLFPKSKQRVLFNEFLRYIIPLLVQSSKFGRILFHTADLYRSERTDHCYPSLTSLLLHPEAQLSESPFGSDGRHDMEALAYEIGTEFHFCSKTLVDIFPTLYVSEIYPKLRLSHEYEFSTLPWSDLPPEIRKSVEGDPMIEEIKVPYSCELEIADLTPAESINRTRYGLVHC